MSSRNEEIALHKAVRNRQVEIVRKLLYEKQCDPNTVNTHGKTAAFMYFINLLTKANEWGSDDCITTDEIVCFSELLWFTYDTEISMENERNEIFDMIDYCYQFCDTHIQRKLYMEIVNCFITPLHHRRYFVQRILKANLPSDYCLIGSMFPMNELLIDTNFVNLRSNFLSELITLFLANESFFSEYIAEVMSTGWSFNIEDQSKAFCTTLLAINPSIKTLFNFMKHLILYDIDFDEMIQFCIINLSYETAVGIVCNVFIPLSNFINVPIDLARVLRQANPRKLSYYNFNQTRYVLDDFHTFVDSKCTLTQVVSLKNLTRMSVRKYFFQNHSHYRALSLLYSLDIPIKLRNFLCYNECNLQF